MVLVPLQSALLLLLIVATYIAPDSSVYINFYENHSDHLTLEMVGHRHIQTLF